MGNWTPAMWMKTTSSTTKLWDWRLETTSGFEPEIPILQNGALPLGHAVIKVKLDWMSKNGPKNKKGLREIFPGALIWDFFSNVTISYQGLRILFLCHVRRQLKLRTMLYANMIPSWLLIGFWDFLLGSSYLFPDVISIHAPVRGTTSAQSTQI